MQPDRAVLDKLNLQNNKTTKTFNSIIYIMSTLPQALLNLLISQSLEVAQTMSVNIITSPMVDLIRLYSVVVVCLHTSLVKHPADLKLRQPYKYHHHHKHRILN